MSDDTVTPHKLCVRAVAEYLLAGMDEAWGLRTRVAEQEAEIERLMTENWQLKGALGYEIPADIPPGPYKCGMCEARWRERAMSDHHQRDHKGNCQPDCVGCEVERLRLEATKTNEISEENTKLRVLIRRLTEHIDDLEERLWG